MWESLSNENVVEDSSGKYDDDIVPESFRTRPATTQERRGPAKDLKGVDWNCPQCDNLNWSWRTTCNKCNTAKPTSHAVS